MYNTITCEDLKKLIVSGQEGLIIIDSRFDFQFNGGHIKNAICINKFDNIEENFFENPYEGATIVIYGEYDKNKSCYLYKRFREFDRLKNYKNYPKLTYPNLFILEGGFTKFFAEQPNSCEGTNISTHDARYIRILRSALTEYKESIRRSNEAYQQRLHDYEIK